MRPSLARVLAAMAAFAVFAACGRFAGSIHTAKPFASSGSSYGKSLEKSTRRAELYEGVGTVAKCWATWKSLKFREALVAARNKAYGSNDGRDSAEPESGEIDFHLALYSPEKEMVDLASENSIWRVTLELPDGQTIAPIQIQDVPKNVSNSIEYPYVTPWTREYSLKFNQDRVEPDYLVLILAGPLGTMRFDYR